MCCFEEALRNCCGFMDPYGDMPLAGGMTASAEVEIMDMENGVHVSVVKTPPRNGRIRLSEVLESIMGPQMGLECVDDQAKRKPEKHGAIDDGESSKPLDDAKHEDSGTMDTAKPTGFTGQGSQPWADGKSSVPSQTKTTARDGGRKDKTK